MRRRLPSAATGSMTMRPTAAAFYRSTRLISSKRLSEFEDFPMPEDYPDFPSHRQMLDYFKAYAARFELLPKIALNTRVEKRQAAGRRHLVGHGSRATGGQRTESFEGPDRLFRPSPRAAVAGLSRQILRPDAAFVRIQAAGAVRESARAGRRAAAFGLPTSPSTWRASPRPSPSACATAITSCLR